MLSVDDRLITIRGLIIPVNWDEMGKVTAIAASTFDEEEYMLDYNKKIDRLFSLIRKEVEVTGYVRKEKGKKIMKVQKFHVKRT
ncbi:MAG: hypothetical protein PVH99_12025 [Desulfobacteraceae bacterium]|jgi:hypothetical protein